MKSPIDLIGGFYTIDGLNWACQDTVNYLPMSTEVGGTKTPTMLKTPPGLRPYCELPGQSVRGMHDAEGQLFVVVGSTLYQIINAVGIPRGQIPGVGRVSIEHNQIAGGNEILVVNGNSGYVYNTRTQNFGRITDPGYPGAFIAGFIDGYLVQAEPFGRYAFHSDLANAREYNTLDRFEAESQPDRIVSLLVSNDEVRVFGTRSTQVFANTGANQGTFQSKGITIERGCAGRFTPCRLDNGVFFLGDDGCVYRDNGYSPVRISTHAIEEAISGNDWSQAFAFAWTSQGHSVYYLTFPDGQTWGYDVSSGLWHRRSSYHPSYEVSRRWRLNDLVYSNGKWYGGDSTSGKIYELDWGYMYEGDVSMVSERTSQKSYNAGMNFQVNELELLIRTGEQVKPPVSFEIQPDPPTISGEPPDGDVDEEYSFTYTVLAGSNPIVRYTIFEGSLPAGLKLDQLTGTIFGTPTKAGPVSVTVRVTDSVGLYADIKSDFNISVEPCGVATDYGGGEAFPTVKVIGLGSESGLVTLKYATAGNPDKFEVWFDGEKVIDTGYHGDVFYQPDLDASLASRGLPPSSIIQRPGSDATPEEQWDNGNYETATFTKSGTTSVAEVRVFGPLIGTRWIFSLDCPT